MARLDSSFPAQAGGLLCRGDAKVESRMRGRVLPSSRICCGLRFQLAPRGRRVATRRFSRYFAAACQRRPAPPTRVRPPPAPQRRRESPVSPRSESAGRRRRRTAPLARVDVRASPLSAGCVPHPGCVGMDCRTGWSTAAETAIDFVHRIPHDSPSPESRAPALKPTRAAAAPPPADRRRHRRRESSAARPRSSARPRST